MERPARRVSALAPTSSPTTQPDMYHRPYPVPRSSTGASSITLDGPSPHLSVPRASPRLTPSPLVLTPLHNAAYFPPQPPANAVQNGEPSDSGPRVCGMPLKYVSLVTLAVQNAALSIVMHYSRVSTPAAKSYSPATAVLLNELLKGSISFFIAFLRVSSREFAGRGAMGWFPAFRKVCKDIFSPDCWKLSIPALLYVVQNSLQFVAISNLPVATFQVTYQMKILTTAAFSVMLLRKKLSSTKWLSLFFLAIGVGIVQIQSSTSSAPKPRVVGSAHEYHHIMNPLKGFGAVTAACFTSGLAGVYFEMVLKNSKADLWVRNVQLSLFSLVPAILPILFEAPSPHARDGIIASLLRNFGPWAWATVAVQVLGGLITAVVIKYSDNILKGFATSLSIVLSFLASVALFGFSITPSFLIGSSTVLAATFMYNQPPGQELVAITKVMPGARAPTPSFPPVSPKAPILGQFPADKKTSSPFGSPRIISSALGLGSEKPEEDFGQMLGTSRYLNAPYGSPLPSRTPSPYSSRPASPIPMSPYPSPQNAHAPGWQQ